MMLMPGRKFRMNSKMAQNVSPVLPEPSLMQPLLAALFLFWFETLLQLNPERKIRTRGTREEPFEMTLGTDVNTELCLSMVLKWLQSGIKSSRCRNLCLMKS